MASKPTQRTCEQLRAQGYVVGIVEKFNSFVKIRQDFPYDSHGFGDIIAYHPELNHTLAIQTTSDSHMANRRTKILNSPNAKRWVAQPSRMLEIWGWGKKGERGKRKTWQLRVIRISLADFDTMDLSGAP